MSNQLVTLEDIKSVIEPGLKDIKGATERMDAEQKAAAKLIKEVQDDLAKERTAAAEMRKQLDDLRKSQLNKAQQRFIRPGQAVTDECALFLAASCVVAGEAQRKLDQHEHRDRLLGRAAEMLGISQKTALSTSDIPMPTDFYQQVVELVLQYGDVRRYMTTFPIGTLTNKLPKLSTSPAFGVINQSATVTEKSPQIAYVTFTPFKNGGLVRIPSEIDADNMVQLGQFLARYVAREGAKWEDTVGFLGDGTGTYGSVSGVGKKADTLSNKIQLGAGNGKPSNLTLANFRDLRAKPDAAALANGAYYMHPTMEALLSTFNTSATVTPYRADKTNPTLDGFPIKWVGVMPVYQSSTNTFSAYQAHFGDLSYWYFGERKGWDIQVSRDVFFATDEIALRALERFDIQLMADNAVATLQLSAS